MFISKKSCCDLADLNTFTRLPEKLHRKRSVHLTRVCDIRLKQIPRRLINIRKKPGRISISRTDWKHICLRLCLLSVRNADHIHFAIIDPGHHIKLKSIIVLFYKHLFQICKFCGSRNLLSQLPLIINNIDSSGTIFIHRLTDQRIRQILNQLFYFIRFAGQTYWYFYITRCRKSKLRECLTAHGFVTIPRKLLRFQIARKICFRRNFDHAFHQKVRKRSDDPVNLFFLTEFCDRICICHR